MITAIDTNVLLDLLIPDAPDAERAATNLDACAHAGALIVSPIVTAELGAFFPDERPFTNFVEGSGLRIVPSGPSALWQAGRAWKTYSRNRKATACPRCGAARPPCPHCGSGLGVRQHILTDFLIGAHAVVHADQLLTRDRGYYRTYFPKLRLA